MSPDADPRRGSGRAAGLVALVLVAGGVLFAVLGPDLLARARDAARALDAAGPAGRVGFVAAYALGTLLGLPGWIPTVAAGAAFPFVEAVALSFGGATAGSLLAFVLGRRLFRAAVARRLAGRPRLLALDDALARRGLVTVGLLRLSPLVPFNALNWALGATRVAARDVALGGLAMLPGTLLYVGLGRGLADAADARLSGRAKSPEEWALLGVGLVATLVVTVLVGRASARALRRREGGADAASDSAPGS